VIHDAQFLLPPMEPLFPVRKCRFHTFLRVFRDFWLNADHVLLSPAAVCGIACSRFHSQVRVEEGGCKWKTT
jgi:hypothetical protein